MTKYNNYIILALLLIGLFSYSCKDDYNDHYDRSGALPEESLYDLIKSDPDLSTYARLIEIGSYQDTLSATQTYTVWAPENSALSDVDLNTITEVQARLIVSNHIARFNNSTTTPDGKPIRMENRKIYTYSGAGTAFAGVEINRHDILAKNGLLHTLKEQIQFHYNLYEYIKAVPGVSKLRDFVSRFDEEIFDEDASTSYIDPVTNQLMYDSVMIFYNRLFDAPLLGLGYIHSEDSIYTMLMPTNEAWDAAYARISPSFKAYNANQRIADSITEVQTSLAIVNDLIYRKFIPNPAAQDSLISTSPSVIHNPDVLFGGLTSETASNGLIFSINDLRYDNRDTWDKFVEVECENVENRLPLNTQTTSVTTREVAAGGEYFVSGLRYLEVSPVNPGTNPEVTIQIPNVLAGKYDIYVEFLPGTIDGLPEGAVPTDCTKLQFVLTYANAKGADAFSIARGTKNLITSPTEKVRMKVFSDFSFPISNYYDRIWMIDLQAGLHSLTGMKVRTLLKIQTDVSNAELNANTYTRKFRVDRVIFEPVVK